MTTPLEVPFSLVADCQLKGEAARLLDEAVGGDYPTHVPTLDECSELLRKLHALHPTSTFAVTCRSPLINGRLTVDYKLTIASDGVVRHLCKECAALATLEYDYGPKSYRCDAHPVEEVFGAIRRLP